MSVIDSRKYGRPNMTNLSREDFMRIKNTPPPDRAAIHAESQRIMQRALAARARRLAEEGTSPSTD